MKKTIALIFLLIVVVGMAHLIEVQARPDTGKAGVQVHGGHEH